MFEIKRGFGINDGGVMKGVSEEESLAIGGLLFVSRAREISFQRIFNITIKL